MYGEKAIVTVHLSKMVNGSSMARIYKAGYEMLIVLPQFVIVRAQGFDKSEQTKIIIALAREKESLLEKASMQNYEQDIEI